MSPSKLVPWNDASKWFKVKPTYSLRCLSCRSPTTLSNDCKTIPGRLSQFSQACFLNGFSHLVLCGRVWLHQSRKIDESGNTCANPSSICARYAARGTTLKTCVVPSRPRKPDKILGRNLENCPQLLFSFFFTKEDPPLLEKLYK